MQACSTCHCDQHCSQLPEQHSMIMRVCSPSPTCSQYWMQKHSQTAYQQTWTMPHRAHFGWQGFPGLSIRVINFSRNAWEHNVFYGLTFSAPRAAPALVRTPLLVQKCIVLTLLYTFVQPQMNVLDFARVRCSAALLCLGGKHYQLASSSAQHNPFVLITTVIQSNLACTYLQINSCSTNCPNASADTWKVLISMLGVLQEQRHHIHLPFSQEAS